MMLRASRSCDRKEPTMRKLMVAAAVAASLTGGAAAGVALFTPTLATAQDDAQETPQDEQAPREAPDWMREALAPLVENGTITQGQADAALDAIAQAKPERPHRPFLRHRIALLDTAAEAIGIEPAELREALRNGQTIAQVSQANDVDPQRVVDALVAEHNEHLDEAVANGRLTQEQADERKANAEERFTDLVNGELRLREGRPGRPGGPGPGGPGSGEGAGETAA